MTLRIGLVAGVVTLVGWLASVAVACGCQRSLSITATEDCSGLVAWTAHAWDGPAPESRVNPDVRVWASYDGGTTWTQVGAGAFTTADGYGFSGTFTAAEPNVLLKVHEEANWPYDDAAPGTPHYWSLTAPTDCSQQPPTPPTPPSTPPSRTGYCDENGNYWNLYVGQETQPPYSDLHLRPADVDAITGSQYCAIKLPVVADIVQPTPPAVTPPVQKPVVQVKGVKKVVTPVPKAKPKAVKPVHRAAPKLTPKPKPKAKPKPRTQVHAATLPFTK